MKHFNVTFFLIPFGNCNGGNHYFFTTFLLLYLICLTWNLCIIVTINVDRHLQSPMYFFLYNLSIVDVLYSTVTLPKLLDLLLTGNNRISTLSCLLQFYLFASLACTEIFILTVMAYDRYVAICEPLHYSLVMRKGYCVLLVVGSWLFGYFNCIFPIVVVSRLNFCKPRLLNQIFCDVKSIMKISCSDTLQTQAMKYIECSVVGVCPFLFTFLSYIQIISNILKVHSAGTRSKLFSTCTSHLIVLSIFYGTLFFMHVLPESSQSTILDQIFSVLFLALTPSLNPLIYSLRNQEMKTSLKKIVTNIYLNMKKIKFGVTLKGSNSRGGAHPVRIQHHRPI